MSRLKQKLKERGLSQTELARITNVKMKTLNRSCQTGIKTIRLAKRYAKALNCDWKDLLG